MHFLESAGLATRLPFLVASVAAVFVFLGLWTPVAGTVIAILGVWIFFAVCASHSLTPIIVAVLGATVAMIGPGMWSIDARLYGRNTCKTGVARKIHAKKEYVIRTATVVPDGAS